LPIKVLVCDGQDVLNLGEGNQVVDLTPYVPLKVRLVS